MFYEYVFSFHCADLCKNLHDITYKYILYIMYSVNSVGVLYYIIVSLSEQIPNN